MKMKKYIIEYRETVYGTYDIEANSKEEALKKFDEDEYDIEYNDTENFTFLKRVVRKEGNTTIIDSKEVDSPEEAIYEDK